MQANNGMKLISQNQTIHVDKTNGTEVDYYLLEDVEICLLYTSDAADE